jgi:SP family general alpha glucoside:H+ symporter-like MFS transporter
MRRNSHINEGREDYNTLHSEDTVVRKASMAVENFAEISAEVKDAIQKEHEMSFMQAIKLYPKAVGWSILLSTANVMEGYDVLLLSSFYALPQFNKKYGVLDSDGTYTVSAPWKSGLSNGALCGEILGLFISGIISEKYGYRKTMIASLAMMITFLRAQHSNSPCRRNPLRNPVGCFSNTYYRIRIRSLARRSPCPSLHLR